MSYLTLLNQSRLFENRDKEMFNKMIAYEGMKEAIQQSGRHDVTFEEVFKYCGFANISASARTAYLLWVAGFAKNFDDAPRGYEEFRLKQQQDAIKDLRKSGVSSGLR